MPNWLKNILLFAVLPASLLLGGTKWYVSKIIDEGMQNAVSQLAPVGTLKYSEAYYTLGGDIVIDDLEFTPRRKGGTFFAKQARAEIKNSDGSSIIFGNNQPGSGTFLLKGIDMTLLTGSLGRNSLSGNPMEAEGCGDINYFTSGDLMEMGFNNIQTDLAISFHIKPPSGQFTTQFSATISPLSELHLNLEFSFPPVSQEQFTPFALAQAKLSHFDGFFEDNGFIEQRNAFCLDKKNSQNESFSSRHTIEAQKWLQARGWKMGAETESIYQQFQETSNNKLVLISSPKAIPLAEITRYSLTGWLNSLKIQHSIGNSRPTKLVLRKYSVLDDTDNNSQATMKKGNGLNAHEEKALRNTINQPKRLANSNLKVITKKNLPKYLNKRIKIYSANGNFHQGVLVKITDTKIILNVRRGAGYATYPISLSRIRKITDPN